MARRPEDGADVGDVNLAGRTVLVTGATSGVGREAALALGRLGARVLVHGRDRERGEDVVDDLRSAGSPEPRFFRADFRHLPEVRDLASAVSANTRSLDVLVNNAGAYFRDGGLTAEGVERTFAVNHLAPFLLTNLLLPSIPADGRVVIVASEAHRSGELRLRDVQTIADYDGFAAYARSKLANLLFTFELARRLDDRTANCCHPGLVPGSDLWRDAPIPIRAVMAALSVVPPVLTGGVTRSPARGAETPAYLAASPAVEGATGEYFGKCEPIEPSAAAREELAARKLWRFSAELVGLPAAETPSR